MVAPADASHVPPLLQNICKLKDLPSCTGLCAKAPWVPDSAHNRPPVCLRCPGCRPGCTPSAGRGKPGPPPSLSSSVDHQTQQSVVLRLQPEPVDMKCYKYTSQPGSMRPKGLFADTSTLTPRREAEMPISPIRSINPLIPEYRSFLRSLLSKSGCAGPLG